MEPGCAASVSGTDRNIGGLLSESQYTPSLGGCERLHSRAQFPAFKRAQRAGCSIEPEPRSKQHCRERLSEHERAKSVSVLLCVRRFARVLLSGKPSFRSQ